MDHGGAQGWQELPSPSVLGTVLPQTAIRPTLPSKSLRFYVTHLPSFPFRDFLGPQRDLNEELKNMSQEMSRPELWDPVPKDTTFFFSEPHFCILKESETRFPPSRLGTFSGPHTSLIIATVLLLLCP